MLLISAGVGATPVLAMLHALAAARPAGTSGGCTGRAAAPIEPFAAESGALLAALPGAHRHICYSSPGPGDVRGRDYDTAGRLSAPVLAALDLPRDAEAYVCGPACLHGGRVRCPGRDRHPGRRIRTEVFGAAPAITPGIARQRQPPGRRTSPPGNQAAAPWSRSRAAT